MYKEKNDIDNLKSSENKLRSTNVSVFTDTSNGNYTKDIIGEISSSDFPNGITTSNLKSVVLGTSVTSIGNDAFNGCSQLTSIDIPDSVTSIGHGVFSNCTSLTSIDIPDSVTSIGNAAFRSCTSLTQIIVDNNNANYDDESGILFNKNQTVLIRYPADKNGSTYQVPSSVTSISNEAFQSCTKLTSITIPNSVTSIGNFSFNRCTKLTSITIPNSVTSIAYGAFSDCSELSSITLPTNNNFTSIGVQAFRDCTLLTSIDIPNSVTSIGNGAFRDSGLTTVNLSSNNQLNYTSDQHNTQVSFFGKDDVTLNFTNVSVFTTIYNLRLLNKMLKNYGTSVSTLINELDLNNDGSFNEADFTILINNWGSQI